MIHPHFTKFLGCCWRGQYYHWDMFPFGMKCAPYFFHKIVRERSCFCGNSWWGPLLLLMIWFWWQGCGVLRITLILLWLPCLIWVGIWIWKSVLVGGTRCEHINFEVSSDSVKGPWLRVLPRKIRKLRCTIRCVLLSQKLIFPVHFLARIAGMCVTMTRAVLPGKLLLWNLFCCIAQRQYWTSSVVLTDPARQDLHWWWTAVKSWNGVPLCPPPVNIQVHTDASGTGWGCSCDKDKHWFFRSWSSWQLVYLGFQWTIQFLGPTCSAKMHQVLSSLSQG